MTLSITPYVSEDGHITMTIDLSQSEFTDRTEKEAPPGTTTRSFRSMVRVKNEETVLLGGIDRAVAREELAGLPFIARRAGAQMDLRHAQEQQTGTPAERIHQTDRGRIKMKNNPSSNRPTAGLCPGNPDRNERLGKAY